MPSDYNLSLELFFLGGFLIVINGEPVDIDSWKSKKSLALLKYLMFHPGKRLSRDFLLELFWPEDCELYNLHVAISYIRKKLRKYANNQKEKFIYYRQGYYYFDKSIVKKIDCQEMEDLCQQGLVLEEKEPEKALEKYKRALALYRDHFLVDDLYEDWTMPIREYYIDIYTQLITNAIRILEGGNKYEEAIEICKKSLRYKLYDEDLYYLLISLLIKAGKLAEATRYYQDYSRFIAQEYGLEPAQKFHNLFEKDNKLIASGGFDDIEENNGPFLCDRELFLLLYKLALKRRARYQEDFFLLHIQITGRFFREMKQYLFHLCRKKLREGDVFCHWDKNSILLLLYRVNEEECLKIKDRLLNNIGEGIREKLLVKVINLEKSRDKLNSLADLLLEEV
ncbi:MAG TPA: hypothetical protein GXZ20_04400 [Halanaerobiaceae bacterium]|jgi:DNA-binding SARP family transcriptional activator|nr:BTAD domain-containing putative transcriptional regulator [Bacillota bacterium]HHU92367.1 hypothetical protein [Halanaerobiaceae bacterium]HOA39887.1 BTAD domain-containing putative transcriptional regulator [Halanaerobiales bacterium]HPZ61962.1 BTAD domain-containing putative transcriptional regulator [Halanaerobiales bacterium]HQD03315.1 BTAD domain-containing putative transcriptional regulator [Halanaerobiales bacterium]